MTIRKDLDDMLNSLKNGTPSSSDTEPKKPAEEKHVSKKSIYDSMSVDDLLSALNAEKPEIKPAPPVEKPAAPEIKPVEKPVVPEIKPVEKPIVPEVKPVEKPVVPEVKPIEKPVVPEIKPVEKPVVPEVKPVEKPIVPEVKPVEKPVVPEIKPVEMPSGSDIPEIHLASAVHAEPVMIQETVNVISRAPEIAEPKKVILEPAKAEKPEAPKRKKRIVITGELPDYEAIRQRELEKDRLAREKAEAEKAALDAEINEKSAEENVPTEAETAVFAEPEQIPSIEPADEAFNEPELPEKKEEKPKKGFLSKLKEKFKVEELGGDMPDPEPVVMPAPVEKDEVDSFIDEVNAEAEENAYQPISEELISEPEPETETSEEEQLPSADELIDAAIAAINATDNSAVSEENTEEKPSYPEIAEEADAPESEEASTENEEEEESDPVNSMIADMREDAANAISDLEKPREEKKEEPEEADSETKEAESSDPEAVSEESSESKSIFRKILDEDPEELLNERREKSEADEEIPETGLRNINVRKKLYTILGAVFAVFAVIGLVVSISKGISTIRRFTSGEVKKDGFNEIVYPAVIMDIESFNSPSELSSEQIITASIWSIIMDEDRVSKYTVNPGTDTISIPYMDVEARAVEMFGTEHPAFEHCTVGPVDSRFFYSEGAYNVKVKPITFTYSPEIKSIVKSGSTYTVSVDYVDELPEWMERSVSKSVEFSITERDDGTYCINSMKIEYVKSGNI